MTTLGMDGSDPTTWDPALDGVLVSPENHVVLYEDDIIRVIVKFLPQPLHYVQDLGTRPFHATRIEFKQDFPAGM